jgi:hypothetical protein
MADPAGGDFDHHLAFPRILQFQLLKLEGLPFLSYDCCCYFHNNDTSIYIFV